MRLIWVSPLVFAGSILYIWWSAFMYGMTGSVPVASEAVKAAKHALRIGPPQFSADCRMVHEIVDDLKPGDCGYLWLVFRDNDDKFLAFRPEYIFPKEDKYFTSHQVEMRDDGLHVWLPRGVDIKAADAKLWEPMFRLLHEHYY